MRIPIQYLAELFTAGDPRPVRDVLARLGAMRSFMRDVNLGREPDVSIADAVGMTPEEIEDMHRLLAVAKYEERYVIPTAHAEAGDPMDLAHALEETATECSLDYDGGPGMGGSGPFGESSGGATPIAVENFHMLKQRQTSERTVDPGDTPRRVNLLNWDGKGEGKDLMPPRTGGTSREGAARPARTRRRRAHDAAGAAVGLAAARLPVGGAARAAARAAPRRGRAAGGRRRAAAAAVRPPGGDHRSGRRRPHYTDVFDLRRRCCLYLTYFSHGDTRQRGMALLRFSHAYRTAGAEPVGDELPDHLSVVCEFAAQADLVLGLRLLREHRAGLELVRAALVDAGSPYVDAVEVLRALLGEASEHELDKARELARSGPPEEDVGLEPFGPPELMGARR